MKCKTEGHVFYIGGYRMVYNEHLKHIGTAFGECDHGGDSCCWLVIMPSRGLDRKITLTFQRHVVVDAQSRQTMRRQGLTLAGETQAWDAQHPSLGALPGPVPPALTPQLAWSFSPCPRNALSRPARVSHGEHRGRGEDVPPVF